MPQYRKNGNNHWLRVDRIRPRPRTFREQLRDEIYTLLAWAILIGVILLLVIAWGYYQ